MKSFPCLRDRRILVTGGSGFLGTHLTAALRSLFPAALLSVGSRDCNLLSAGVLDRVLESFRPDLVFHLAAVVGGIGANRRQPGRFFHDNLKMGLNLMEACRRHAVDKVVLVGTVCAYPKFTPIPFREDDLWNGYPEETNAPYGLAKKMLLVQAQAYREQYGFNSIYLLPANLYGPGDHMDLYNSHVIPAIIRKIWEAKRRGDKTVELWGTGRATREFLYVEDAARALMLAAELYNGALPVNIGTGHEVSIRETAETAARLMNYSGGIRWNSEMPDGQPRRCLSVDRAKAAFNFVAEVGFEEGLKTSIEDLTARLEAEEDVAPRTAEHEGAAVCA